MIRLASMLVVRDDVQRGTCKNLACMSCAMWTNGKRHDTTCFEAPAPKSPVGGGATLKSNNYDSYIVNFTNVV